MNKYSRNIALKLQKAGKALDEIYLRCCVLNVTDPARIEATKGEIMKAGEYRKVHIASCGNESSQKGSFPPMLQFLYL